MTDHQIATVAATLMTLIQRGDALAADVQVHGHPRHHSLLNGDFQICQANECKAARAWWAVRENGDRAPLDPMDWI